jgi:energy-coupling factor transporter ATP-binding protein EcfA2
MLLARSGGLLVHAYGVVLEGKGLVFFGRSGAGKSTVARALPEDGVLSDELVALRRESEGVRLCSTPFFGDLVLDRRRREAPLHAALSLVQAPVTSVQPLTEAEAMSRLVACVALPVGDPSLEAEAFRVAADLVPAIRWLEMRFEKNDASIRRVADEALA